MKKLFIDCFNYILFSLNHCSFKVVKYSEEKTIMWSILKILVIII